MDQHMSSFGTLVPEGPSCVLSNKVSSLLRSDTSDGFLLVLWFDIAHTTQTNTQHNLGDNRLTHPYKYILTPPVMRSVAICITLNE